VPTKDVLDIAVHPNQKNIPGSKLLSLRLMNTLILFLLWNPLKSFKAEVKKHQEYARKTLKKNKRVNIRISSIDLEEIQALAVENGIPYQTLMTSILHRYVHGSLIDKPRPNKAVDSGG